MRVAVPVGWARLTGMQVPQSSTTIGPPVAWHRMPRALRYVAVGGAMGAAARWGLVEAAGDARAVEATMAVNVVGALLLGVLLGLRSPRRRRPRITVNWFLLLGSGFAASFTSFPAFALQVAEALDTGALARAGAVGPATALLAVVAGGLGYRLGSWR